MKCALLDPSVICKSVPISAGLARSREAQGVNLGFIVTAIDENNFFEDRIILSSSYSTRDAAVRRFQYLFDRDAYNDFTLVITHYSGLIETTWRRPPVKKL